MLRKEDVFARIGGEEFAIIARGIDEERAYVIAERVRTTLGAAQVDFDKRRIPLSVSVGVASLACCGESASPDDLVGRADERLYAAKRGGRNRSVGAVPRS
jgi:diguanylate cyclase (GGDEF)-like protein